MAQAIVMSAVVLAYGNAVALTDADTQSGPLAYADLILALGLIAWLRWSGLGRDELGLGGTGAQAIRQGAVGAGAGLLLTAAPVAFIVIAPAFTGDSAEAQGAADMSGAEFAYRALIFIPIATALPEELMFRGALFGAWQIQGGTTVAVVASSVVFALWHGVISFGTVADAGVVSHPALIGIGYVLALTGLFIAGVVLALLRVRTGGVAAPVGLHWSVNAAILFAVWVSA